MITQPALVTPHGITIDTKIEQNETYPYEDSNLSDVKNAHTTHFAMQLKTSGDSVRWFRVGMQRATSYATVDGEVVVSNTSTISKPKKWVRLNNACYNNDIFKFKVQPSADEATHTLKTEFYNRDDYYWYVDLMRDLDEEGAKPNPNILITSGNFQSNSNEVYKKKSDGTINTTPVAFSTGSMDDYYYRIIGHNNQTVLPGMALIHQMNTYFIKDYITPEPPEGSTASPYGYVQLSTDRGFSQDNQGEFTFSGSIGSQSSTQSLFNKTDGYVIASDFLRTPYYFFQARTTPEVKLQYKEYTVNPDESKTGIIKDFPTEESEPITFGAKEIDFTASYKQKQGISIKCYTFKLYDGTSNAGTLIDQSDTIYSSNIQYSYDGFIGWSKEVDELLLAPTIDMEAIAKAEEHSKGHEYYIELETISQQDVKVTKGAMFYVNYNHNLRESIDPTKVSPQIVWHEKKSAAEIKWVDGQVTKGIPCLQSIITNARSSDKLDLRQGCVTWNVTDDKSMTIADAGIVFQTAFGEYSERPIIEMQIEGGYTAGLRLANGCIEHYAPNGTCTTVYKFYDTKKSAFQDYSQPEERVAYYINDSDEWNKNLLVSDFSIDNKTFLIKMNASAAKVIDISERQVGDKIKIGGQQ